MPRDASAAEDARKAGLESQAAVNAVVHGAVKPEAILHPKRRGGPAPAGPYELVALVWHEPKRDAHGRLFTVKHERGDIVELGEGDADRLLRAGAVRPTTTEQEESEAAKEEDPLTKAKRFEDAHGPVAAKEGDEPTVANPPATPTV